MIELPAGGSHGQVRIFLSHASTDEAVAVRLRAELESLGLVVWLASKALRIGENYAEHIYNQLRKSDCVVILLSRASMSSAHVRRELSVAVDLNRMVLPIALSSGLVGSTDMPVDWRYWLSIVQVVPLTTVEDTAEVIWRRLKAPASLSDKRSAPAKSVEAERDKLIRTTVRTSLIDAATEGRPFRVVLDRCRKLHCCRSRLEQIANEFKAAGLIDFVEPLEDTTTLRLAT